MVQFARSNYRDLKLYLKLSGSQKTRIILWNGDQTAPWDLKQLKYTEIHAYTWNGVLFRHIHEGVQASQKYGNPDEYKSRIQSYSGAHTGKNTEDLRSTSLENHITAALTGGEKYGKPDGYKSRKQHYGGATREKIFTKATLDEQDKLGSSQTSTLNKSLPNSLAESSCRSARQCISRSFPLFSSLSCSRSAAGDSCSH